MIFCEVLALERTILHSDLNNFYASVELLSHPELKGSLMQQTMELSRLKRARKRRKRRKMWKMKRMRRRKKMKRMRRRKKMMMMSKLVLAQFSFSCL